MSIPPSDIPINQQPPPYDANNYTNQAYSNQYGGSYGENPIQMQPVAGKFQTAPLSGLEMLANLQKIHVHQEVHLIEGIHFFQYLIIMSGIPFIYTRD